MQVEFQMTLIQLQGSPSNLYYDVKVLSCEIFEFIWNYKYEESNVLSGFEDRGHF